jgi:cytochrome c biogenesis protein CcmG, thiol:disulfide interchange protein DsbE
MGAMEQEATEPRSRSRWLRTLLLVAPAVAFVVLLVAAVMLRESPPEVGDRAPRFEAELLGREGRLDLAELRGRPVVINFWASWCVPCEDEAPMLREAAARYGDQIAFVGVDIRDARSEALAFVEKWDLNYQHVRDEDLSIYDDYGLTGQPETFFLDENGVILEHVPGPLFRDTLFPLLDSMSARAA